MSTIVLKAYPQSMFIDGNYLTIFGTDYETDSNPINPGPIKPIPMDSIAVDEPLQSTARIIGRPIIISRQFTWVYIYDISKKASPKLIKNYTLAGSYQNGRKSEETGFVYIVANQDCRTSDSVMPWYNFGNGRKNMTLSQIFYYPVPEYSGVTFTNILAFNLRNPLGREENTISFISLSSWILYMS